MNSFSFNIDTSRLVIINITKVDLGVSLTLLIECGDGSKSLIIFIVLSVSLTKCFGYFVQPILFYKISRNTRSC